MKDDLLGFLSFQSPTEVQSAIESLRSSIHSIGTSLVDPRLSTGNVPTTSFIAGSLSRYVYVMGVASEFSGQSMLSPIKNVGEFQELVERILGQRFKTKYIVRNEWTRKDVHRMACDLCSNPECDIIVSLGSTLTGMLLNRVFASKEEFNTFCIEANGLRLSEICQLECQERHQASPLIVPMNSPAAISWGEPGSVGRFSKALFKMMEDGKPHY